MSNVIPPLVSTTPPPVLPEDDEDDDFGNFTAANEYSYDESLSLPTTPHRINLIPPSTYQATNLSVELDNLPENELKANNSENDKDNTSQDSVPSFLTSDSGLSEVHSNFSDEVIMHEKEEAINNNIYNIDFQNDDRVNEKDFLDVRNKVSDIVSEEILNSSVTHETDQECNFESNCIEEPLEIYETLDSTILNKDYKDKRKDMVKVADVTEVTDNQSELTTETAEVCKQQEHDEPPVTDSYETEVPEMSRDLSLSPEEIPEINDTADSNVINCDQLITNTNENTNDFDDFQTFKTAAAATFPETNVAYELDDGDEFTNFQSTDVNTNATEVVNNDDFDDFGDFENFQQTPSTTEQVQPNEFNDEIEPFADFSTASALHPTEELNADQFDLEIVTLFSTKNMYADKGKIHGIIKKVFKDAFDDDMDVNGQNLNQCTTTDDNISSELLTKCNLWERLSDIENLKPLNYRWDMSNVYKRYLKVINIDMRNILYGSTLNMPRFVANLGGTPLEPLKPIPVETKINENPVSTSTCNNNTEQSNEASSISFDWTDSEFVNTLESTMDKSETLKIEKDQILESVVNLDISALNTFENQIISAINKDTESVKSLNFTDLETLANSETLPNNDETNNTVSNDTEFTEFTDFHSSIPASSTNFTQMNLRETHISTPQTNFNFSQAEIEDKPAWLQPTVLTPELTRKTNNFTENKNDIVSIKELTLDVATTENEIKPNQPPLSTEDDDFTDFQFASDITKTSTQSGLTTSTHSSVNSNSFLPISTCPLEPIKLQSDVKPKNNVEINWPEPGISDDDLVRLSNIRINTSVNSKPTELASPIQESIAAKESQMTNDDDWSDFVCVSDPTKSTNSSSVSTKSNTTVSQDKLDERPKFQSSKNDYSSNKIKTTEVNNPARSSGPRTTQFKKNNLLNNTKKMNFRENKFNNLRKNPTLDVEKTSNNNISKLLKSNEKQLEEPKTLQFILRIAEDIIRNKLYKDDEILSVIANHVEVHKNVLEKESMQKVISDFLININFVHLQEKINNILQNGTVRRVSANINIITVEDNKSDDIHEETLQKNINDSNILTMAPEKEQLEISEEIEEEEEEEEHEPINIELLDNGNEIPEKGELEITEEIEEEERVPIKLLDNDNEITEKEQLKITEEVEEEEGLINMELLNNDNKITEKEQLKINEEEPEEELINTQLLENDNKISGKQQLKITEEESEEELINIELSDNDNKISEKEQLETIVEEETVTVNEIPKVINEKKQPVENNDEMSNLSKCKIKENTVSCGCPSCGEIFERLLKSLTEQPIEEQQTIDNLSNNIFCITGDMHVLNYEIFDSIEKTELYAKWSKSLNSTVKDACIQIITSPYMIDACVMTEPVEQSMAPSSSTH